MGLIQFLPELNQWRLQKEFWRLVIQRKQGWRVRSTTIRCMPTCLQIIDPLATSLQDAMKWFQQASEKYEALKLQHEALHQSFLLARLQDPTITDMQQVAISHLVAKECVCDAYHWIRALKGIPASTSISQVEITKPQGNCLVTNCAAVEQVLCQSLQKRSTKAHGSPFLHPPLLQDVGFLRCGSATKEILEGSYQCPQTQMNTRIYLLRHYAGPPCAQTSFQPS